MAPERERWPSDGREASGPRRENCRRALADIAELLNNQVLTNDAVSPLFLAAIEATEEAIYNSMLRATTMTGNGHTIAALPIEKTVQILKEHRVIP